MPPKKTPTAPPKRGRGRPPKPPGERTRVVTVRLPEKVIDWLDRHGSFHDELKRLAVAEFENRGIS